MSDPQPFRSIGDWPKDDVEPILQAEDVDQFMVQGISYGTAHAMATGSYFGPEVCVAMGLIVPYLPRDVCREFGFHTDDDIVLNASWLRSPMLSPLYSIFTLTWGLLTKLSRNGSNFTEGPAVKKADPTIMDALAFDVERCAVRGVHGQMFEMLNGDTNQVCDQTCADSTAWLDANS